MVISDICEFIIKEIAANHTTEANDKYISDFLFQLRDSKNLFSQRLLVCIGIDLKTYNKRFPSGEELDRLKFSFRGIILNIPNVVLPKSIAPDDRLPHVYFGFSIVEFGYAECKPGIKAYGTDKYVRVCNLNTLIRFLILQDNPSINAIVKRRLKNPSTRPLFFENITDKKITAIQIAKWSSLTGYIFAAKHDELWDPIINGNLDEVLDQIGYYLGEDIYPDKEYNRYIYIEYPENFVEEMLQPTALIGDWGKKIGDSGFSRGNEFFLSYWENPMNWGQTFPVTGNGSGVKERAHMTFSIDEKKPYEFSIGYVNTLTKLLSKATDDKIIKEAIKRFKSA